MNADTKRHTYLMALKWMRDDGRNVRMQFTGDEYNQIMADLEDAIIDMEALRVQSPVQPLDHSLILAVLRYARGNQAAWYHLTAGQSSQAELDAQIDAAMRAVGQIAGQPDAPSVHGNVDHWSDTYADEQPAAQGVPLTVWRVYRSEPYEADDIQGDFANEVAAIACLEWCKEEERMRAKKLAEELECDARQFDRSDEYYIEKLTIHASFDAWLAAQQRPAPDA